MTCDVILAAETAKFGQRSPWDTAGGGTERLACFIGKSTGNGDVLHRPPEGERAGLVSRIVPSGEVVSEAIRAAARIAGLSRPITMMIKECVNRADETALAEELVFERRMLHAAFSLQDQKEGMTAFVHKRPPRVTNR